METKIEKVIITREDSLPEIGQRAKSRYSESLSSGGMAETYNPSDVSFTKLEKMEQDPELSLGLKILKSPLFNADWDIKCEDSKVRAFLIYAYGLIHRSFINSASRALERGFNPHEKVWMKAEPFEVAGKDEDKKLVTYLFENAVIYEKIKEIWPGDVTIIKKQDKFAGFKQKGTTDITIELDKAVICTWDERDGNKYGRSIFLNAYDSWHKDKAMDGHMMMYMERKGAPSVIVEYPPGNTKDKNNNVISNREIAMTLGTSMMNNGVVTLPFEPKPERPEESKWKIYYIEDNKGVVNFVTVHTQIFVTAKLRSLFIPDLAAVKAVAEGGGAFALGKVHKSVLTDIREDIIQWYQGVVNEYILPDLLNFNFIEPPKAEFALQGLSDNTKDLWLEIIKGLSQNPAFVNQVDTPAMLDGLGIPVAQEKEQEPTATEALIPESPSAVEEKTEQRRHNLHRQHNHICCGRQFGEPFKLWRDKFEWEEKINFAKIFETVETGTADVVTIIKGLTKEHQIQIEKKITQIWKENKTREARLKAISEMAFGGGTYDAVIRKELTKIATVGLKEVVAETGLKGAGLVLPDATRTAIEISSKGFTKSYVAGLENEVARGLTGVADMDIVVAKTALKTTFDKYVEGSGSQIANANLLRETSLLTSNAFNEGRAAIMEEGPSKELVAGKMISNALDSNVCPFCAEIGGGRGGSLAMGISVDDEDYDIMEPPFHESCRCFSVYIMKDQIGVETWDWSYKRPDEDLLLYATQVRGVSK